MSDRDEHDEIDDEIDDEPAREPTLIDVLGGTIVAMQAQLDVAATIFRIIQVRAQGPDDGTAQALTEEQREELAALLHLTGGKGKEPATFGQKSKRPHSGPADSSHTGAKS